MIAGALFGPIGMLVGGAIGVIAGAAAGHGIAEQIDPTGEVEYWRNAHTTRSYVDASKNFDNDYRPAYSYGVTSRNQYGQRQWDGSPETELQTGWEKNKGIPRWHDRRARARSAMRGTVPTVRTVPYDASDRYYESRFRNADTPPRDSGRAYERLSQSLSLRHVFACGQSDPQLGFSLEPTGYWLGPCQGHFAPELGEAKAATKMRAFSFERALSGYADRTRPRIQRSYAEHVETVPATGRAQSNKQSQTTRRPTIRGSLAMRALDLDRRAGPRLLLEACRPSSAAQLPSRCRGAKCNAGELSSEERMPAAGRSRRDDAERAARCRERSDALLTRQTACRPGQQCAGAVDRNRIETGRRDQAQDIALECARLMKRRDRMTGSCWPWRRTSSRGLKAKPERSARPRLDSSP